MAKGGQAMKKLMIQLVRVMILILDWVIPKQQNLIIYGCKGGTGYYDNSKIFFEWMNEESKIEWESVWLTSSSRVWYEVLREGHLCYKLRSRKGLWKFLRAQFVVMSHGYGDFDIFLSGRNRKKTIMLWHGIPLKKIGGKDKLTVDLFTVSSRLEKYMMDHAWGFDPSKNITQVLGTPRQDKILAEFLKANKEKTSNKERLVLYAPTYRKGGHSPFPIEYQLEEVLEQNNAILIVRIHADDEALPLLVQEGEHKSRIFFQSQLTQPDVYQFFSSVAVLITDYSSLYFDALLIGMPIIFMITDLEEYERENHFFFPFDVITAGEYIEKVEELPLILNQLLQHFDEAKFEHFEEQTVIKGLFHEVADMNACERIYNWIQENG